MTILILTLRFFFIISLNSVQSLIEPPEIQIPRNYLVPNTIWGKYPAGQILKINGSFFIIETNRQITPLSGYEFLIVKKIRDGNPSKQKEYCIPPVTFKLGDKLQRKKEKISLFAGPTQINYERHSLFNDFGQQKLITPLNGDELLRVAENTGRYVTIAKYVNNRWIVSKLILDNAHHGLGESLP
ncbi:uncharacterized protein LOC117176240 [Belonocnema kinseyi]|uniref:uncharacterized protein LOC117176240 n=1 Tax=Belonocnema kinseyi TaxID=2817044 RepID=UPI00143DBCAA|nr:uncharacterized protein LOC117176240 [Belonocnema kinseyi]